MRLDKFLKVTRLIKRRTLAKEICDAGRININDRTAKASAEVRIGDVITIRYGQKMVKVRVEKVIDNPRKEESYQLYEVLSEDVNPVVDTRFVDDAT